MRSLAAIPLLARRFLLSKSSDDFLSFISWVSIAGVAVGVLALTVVTSVLNGFEGELTRVITGLNGDVVLYSRGEPIREGDAIEDKIRKWVPETQAVTASFVTELMAAGTGGVAGAILEGIDSESIGLVTDIPKRLVTGRLPVKEGEVALTSILAERLGATEGGDIRLIAPHVGQEEEGAKSGEAAPKVIHATVVGIVRMGMYEYDSKFLFAPLSAVQKFLKQPDRVTSFKVKLKPDSDARAVSDRLTDHFGYPFKAKDWGQMNKNIFYAIRLEKVVIAIILTVIVIVAAFNVVSTLMMMIHDKSKDIAILKVMGFRASRSFMLFCLIGGGMGIVGTAIGVASGIGINWILSKTHWIDLPADIYYIGFLPVLTRWSEVIWIAGTALVISFLATIYPAWRVATRPPLEGLRYES